ncbi:hypothetical protein KC850_02745 [Candidatus Kaiserbacteria bacterium]|nr:hypothetical protein [Candidatus Kaiserbacteria bacterium]
MDVFDGVASFKITTPFFKTMQILKTMKFKYGTAVFFAIAFLLFNAYVRFYQSTDSLEVIIELINRAGEVHPILLFNELGFDFIGRGFLFLYSLFSVFLFLKLRDDAKKFFLIFLLSYGVVDWISLSLFQGFPNGIGSFLGAVILFAIFNQTLRGKKLIDLGY